MNTYPYVYIYILFRVETGQKLKSFYEITITVIQKKKNTIVQGNKIID